MRILDSLKQILVKSTGSRIFMTGRAHIQAEIEKLHSRKVISVSLCPNKEDIIRYIGIRLGEDETLDAMDESLIADILEEILESVSEMYVWQ